MTRYPSATKHLRRADNVGNSHQTNKQIKIIIVVCVCGGGGLRTCKERIKVYAYFNGDKKIILHHSQRIGHKL